MLFFQALGLVITGPKIVWAPALAWLVSFCGGLNVFPYYSTNTITNIMFAVAASFVFGCLMLNLGLASYLSNAHPNGINAQYVCHFHCVFQLSQCISAEYRHNVLRFGLPLAEASPSSMGCVLCTCTVGGYCTSRCLAPCWLQRSASIMAVRGVGRHCIGALSPLGGH